MKLTGERPMQGATPDSLLAFHDAGYREVVARLGPGVVVDVGCGVGDETAAPRRARPARGRRRLQRGDDAGRRPASTRATDGAATSARATARALGLRDRSVDYIVSSHIIEHFMNPALHVAELARVLRARRHRVRDHPERARRLREPVPRVPVRAASSSCRCCRCSSKTSTCLGLEGDDVLHADFAARRASGERLLRLDVFGLRHRIPRRAYVWTYERVLPLAYRMLGSERTGIGSGPRRGATSSRPSVVDDATRPGCSRSRRAPSVRREAQRAPMSNAARLGHGPHVRRGREHRARWCGASATPCPDAHILVVDDNSPDGTAEKAEALGAELGGIEVLRRPQKMGLGSAYRAGHAIGIARGYDVMIQIDADLSHDPADLPGLLAAVERGADLAIGSRYVPGGSVPNWPRHRLALSVLGQPLRRVLPRHRRARHDRRLPRVPRVDPAGDRLRDHALDRLRLPDRDDLPRR